MRAGYFEHRSALFGALAPGVSGCHNLAFLRGAMTAEALEAFRAAIASKDLCVMAWIQGITDFLVWVLFPALVLRRICFAFLVYAIGGVFWMSVILFAALRRFCAMAAMTICAWVLATPK